MKRKSKKGMTLIEVIISLAILGIMIVPILIMALGSTKNTLASESKQKSSYIGQKILEEIKAYDEITLIKDGEKYYFKLLDGDKIIKDGSENKYIGDFNKGEYKVTVEIYEDKNTVYEGINNLENIKGETFTLNFTEKVGISNIELVESSTQNKDFKDNLIIKLDQDLRIQVIDEQTNKELINYTSTDNKKNIIIIYVDSSFTSDKTINIQNLTGKTMNVYVVKHNDAIGNVRVLVKEGSLFIQDEINLLEGDTSGKRFNYFVTVKDQNDNILFQGESSKNLIIR